MVSHLNTDFIIAVVVTLVVSSGCYVRQDEQDALKVADRIHSQLKRHDFQAIYRESEESFKAAGDESKLVIALQQIQDAVGALKNATPIAYQSVLDSSAGKKHVLIYNLEFERAPGKEKLTFIRTKDGQMKLFDIIIEPTN